MDSDGDLFWQLRSVKRQLATATKKVDDLKVQLMTSEENRMAQVQTHTDKIMHLEEKRNWRAFKRRER
jgi:hypothetical protein